ncbi:hypothetical protein [Kitasatospora sp. NPDC051914]|uniref:hypothetical protein n=1 Tax=Kitasatospora sp. NPDC051914 TaxID=3154945 RepID=UPI003438DA65
MGIGYLLLYAALAVVALWLIAELLLQNRAPVVWRGVALAGFLTVVSGMRLQSVLVIGAGAAAFAAGQFFVTTSVKRGFVAGWSLRRPDGTLPGPLARVPLLGAATGGAAGAAAVAVPEPSTVGEVGPVEPDLLGAAYAEVEEIADDGVYAEQQVYHQQEQQAWTQQAVPQQPAYQDAYGQQQAGYGYGWDQQWAAQQQAAHAQYQQQDQYAQQAAYAQYQQDPYAAQQFAAQQAQQAQQQGYYYQQGWEYQQQQQQPVVPQQQGHHQQQTWDYQQQG